MRLSHTGVRACMDRCEGTDAACAGDEHTPHLASAHPASHKHELLLSSHAMFHHTTTATNAVTRARVGGTCVQGDGVRACREGQQRLAPETSKTPVCMATCVFTCIKKQGPHTLSLTTRLHDLT
jgi:hypothetical protein